MAKPIEPPPEWASDETNNTEPASLQKETGWEFEQTGVSDYDNWWKRTAQKWFEYVDSNEIDGDLTIDGSLTVLDNLEVQGDAEFASAVEIADNLDVGGSAEITSTLYHGGVLSKTQGFENTFGGAPGFLGGAMMQTIGAGVTMYVPVQAPAVEQALQNLKLTSFTIVCEDILPPTVSVSSQLWTTGGGTTIITKTLGGGLTLTLTETVGLFKAYTYTVSPVFALSAEGRMILKVVNPSGVDQDFYNLTTRWTAARP